MKFHEFKTAKLWGLEELCGAGRHKEAGIVKKLSPREYLRQKTPKIIKTYREAVQMAFGAVELRALTTKVKASAELLAFAATGIRHALINVAESDWFDSNRPFYNVYPVVEKLVNNTKLELPISQLNFVENALCFRFPKGQEPLGIKTALIQLNFNTPNTQQMDELFLRSKTENNPLKLLVAGSFEVTDVDERFMLQIPVPSAIGASDTTTVETLIRAALLPFEEKTSIGHSLSSLVSAQISADLPMYTQRVYFLLRLVVLVSLVAAGNDLITPAVLASEQEKYDKETDAAAKQWLEARAAKIQGRGFNFGKNLHARSETSPHWRNPHMALYWTGAGRTKPALKLRSGSVVIPKHLASVPTGYDCPIIENKEAVTAHEYVYLLEDPSRGFIKIGKTKRSVEERQKESNTFVPGGLKLRGYITTADCTALETRLHRAWAHKRRENEFFELSDADVQQIITQFGGVKQIEINRDF